MKRIKGLFLFAIVFVLGLAVNVNADSCYQYINAFSKNSNTVKSGDIIELSTFTCGGRNIEGLYVTDSITYDKDVFELITVVKPIPTDTGFVSVINEDISDEPGEYRYTLTFEWMPGFSEQEATYGNRFTYKLKVKNVSNTTSVIRAANGDRHFYVINDNSTKSGNNYLSEATIQIVNTVNELHYYSADSLENDIVNKYSLRYQGVSDYNQDSINIMAKADDPKAKIYGTGIVNLKVGLNIIKVVVVAENGDKRTYSFEIHRRDQDGQLRENEYVIEPTIAPDPTPTPTPVPTPTPSPTPEPKDDEKVEEAEVVRMPDAINIYLFTGDGCPHCAEIKEYFKSIEQEYGKYYNIVEYETWNSSENKELLNTVSKSLGKETTNVPFLVVGKEYWLGFDPKSEQGNDIKNAIITEYKSKTRYDAITNKEIAKEETKEPVKEEPKEEPKKLNINYILFGIIAALLLAIVILLFSRKKQEESA